MKLKSFNAENTASLRTGRATVNINHGTGMFTFSKTAVAELGLKKGDKLELHQDETSPKDWYISKSDNGFTLRGNNVKADDYLIFSNASLARTLLESINIDGNATMLIATDATSLDGVEYFAILTKSAKTKA